MVAGPGSCGGGKLPFLDSHPRAPRQRITPPPAVCQLGSDWISQKQTLRWRFGHRNLCDFFFGGESTLGINSCETGEETGLDRGRSWDAT